MNLVLLFQDDFMDGTNRVRLNGRRHKYVREIHRARPGDKLSVGLVNGEAGTGEIISLDDANLEMEVTLKMPPPPPIPLALVLALPRPNVFKRVLFSVSSMGVKKIFIIHAQRVEKSFWLSPVLKQENITEQLILGLEQAKDTVMPQVSIHPRFRPFVEDELPAVIKGTVAFVAHPESVDPCPRDVGMPATLIIGPEGGFIPYEIEKMAACGARPVCLGERILRVESAITAAISKMF